LTNVQEETKKQGAQAEGIKKGC